MQSTHHMIARGAALALVLATVGCQDLTAKLPAGSADPNTYNTPAAAVKMARNVRYEFHVAWKDYVFASGLLTDELRDAEIYGRGIGSVGNEAILDSRYLPAEGYGGTARTGRVYDRLQRIRTTGALVRQTLMAYAPDSAAAWMSELLAYEGLSMVMLADFFCSGIPLSTIDFNEDWTYRAGSPTDEVYTAAIARFDSAIIASESLTEPGRTNMASLARVAKGRALLALGAYDAAETAVAPVMAAWRYALRPPNSVNSGTLLWEITPEEDAFVPSVSDGEGAVGIRFVTVGDPRVVTVPGRINITTNLRRHGVVAPADYVIASYVEARLVAAEAALNAGRTEWLTTLNALRTTSTTCTVKTTPICAAAAPAGTGGVARLPLLTDPALDPLPVGKTAFDVRLDVILQERAFWLFLTGHRQGDLRRVMRNYGRTIEATYPTGAYPAWIGRYDDYVDVPLPPSERDNPRASGCLNRGA